MGSFTIPLGGLGGIPRAGRITAELVSLDTGMRLDFKIPPTEHDREGGATWDEAGVAEADPQPLEYRTTLPQRRAYKIVFDKYSHTAGGLRNSLEKELKTLHAFTKRVPGKFRSHKCLYTQGEQSFRCVLESYRVTVTRIGATGGALQCEATLNLKEIAR